MNAAARLVNRGALSRGWAVSIFMEQISVSVIVLTIALLTTALSIVYVTNATRSLNASVQQILVERDQMHVQWGQLLLERGTRTMPARVEQMAANKLEMVRPDSKSVLIIKDNP